MKTADVMTGKKDHFWKVVLIGGLQGVMFDLAGYAITSNRNTEHTTNKETDAEVQKEEVVEEIAAVEEEAVVEAATTETEAEVMLEIGDAVSVASNVNDGMSFSEAFASARAEVGPGGVFMWNGNLYSTYYEEEWSNMTDDQKEDFGEALYEAAADYQEVSDASNQAAEEGEQVEVYVAEVEVDGHYGEAYQYDDDEQIDEVWIDTDDDGAPDFVLVDQDNDGYFTESEAYNFGDLYASANPEDALYDDMPDYTNDADTSSFA